MEEGSLNNWGGWTHSSSLFLAETACHQCSALQIQKQRGFCRENSRETLSTQLNDRMSGSLPIVADQPRISYLTSRFCCIEAKAAFWSVPCSLQLGCAVAVTKPRRSARPGGVGAADLSETGMFDLVEVPFFFPRSLSQSAGNNVGNKPRLINIDKQREGVAISPAPSHSLLRRCEAFPASTAWRFHFPSGLPAETKTSATMLEKQLQQEACLRSPDN